MAITLTREELYERVWNEPIQTVSRTLGISDVGLAKLCRRQDIPVPPRGYWAKKRAGKTVAQAALPVSKHHDARSQTEVFGPRGIESELPPVAPVAPPRHPLVAAETDPSNRISPPAEDLRITHPLLRSTRDYWKAIKRPFQFWPTSLPRHIQTRIGPTVERRTLRVLQALFAAIEQRGYSISVGERGELQVNVLDEACNVHVRERQRQVRVLRRINRDSDLYADKRPHDLIFTGELELQIGERHRHQVLIGDSASGRIEEQLNDVVIALVEAALAEKEHRAARHRAHLAEMERARERERLLQRQRQTEERLRQFERLAKAADHHRRLVKFRNDVRRTIGKQERSADFSNWLEWIDSYVESIDVLGMFRLTTRQITLYHCVSTYEASAILRDGFKNSEPEHGKDLPASVPFADVPLTGIYGGTRCIEIAVPTQDALPYMAVHTGKEYREFALPEEVANRFSRRLGDR